MGRKLAQHSIRKEIGAPGPQYTFPGAVDGQIPLQGARRDGERLGKLCQRAITVLRLQPICQFTKSQLAALGVFNLCDNFLAFAKGIVVRDG